jgi:uncharacterized protein (TIGR02246 family)
MAQTTEKEILDLEKKFWEAIKNTDKETVMRLSDDDCLLTGSQGFGAYDKKTIASMVDQANYTLDRYALQDDAKVRFIGDDVALVAYKVKEELTVEGKPVSLEAFDASTWVRRNGQWVCALHTETLYGDPFGRDRH